MQQSIRNIAIIAHVDHGKTTLVDKLLHQAGTFAAHQHIDDRVMDSDDIERERGITIFAKNAAITYKDIRINIVDTPGHADFGGEVERVLSMVDGVILLVDAVEGPMPQTRFVTQKALALGLKPVVLINKVDREGARPDFVINATFELFDKLGATEEQLDFPVIYASALQGWASESLSGSRENMEPLFNLILKHVAPPEAEIDEPLQMRISALDYSNYVGRIGVGRIHRGKLASGQLVSVIHEDGSITKTKVTQVLVFEGLGRKEVDEAFAGDIVSVYGINEMSIGETIADIAKPEALSTLSIDAPTLTMTFQVNKSPLAGKEGKFVTSRQIRERLQKELLTNVALKVEDTQDADVFLVSGRGELHLSILVENMRREGYELAVGRPYVITKKIDGVECEPFEHLGVDIDQSHQGAVIEALGLRKGQLVDMVPDSQGRVHIDYRIPARGLIGFQQEFLNLTRGTGLMSHIFEDYAPWAGPLAERPNGVLVSQDDGEIVAYALWKLQDRGRMFVKPNDPVYEGMIIGIHSRDNDLVVNPVKTKQLTNVRASGKDDAILLTPPIELTLEYAIEFIADDELVEVTPQSIRLRKRFLKEHERKREARKSNSPEE